MSRRNFLKMMALGSAPVLIGVPAGGAASYYWPFLSKSRSVGLEEATIAELQAAMNSGAQSSVSLVHWHLRRIEKMDRMGQRCAP